MLVLACTSPTESTPTAQDESQPPAAMAVGAGTWAWRDDQAQAACYVSAAAPDTPRCNWPQSWPGPPHPHEPGFAGVQRVDGGYQPVRLYPHKAPIPAGPTAALVRAVRWSPDGDQLVWEAHSEGVSTVMIGDTTPTGARALHPHPAGSFEPDLHQDGTVVFASSRHGNAELYLATPALVRLTHDPGDDQRPRFSPNGEQLAWLASRQGSTRVFRSRRDGQDALAISPASHEALDFAWSPDSTYIAVVLRLPGQPAAAHIFSAATGATRSVIKPPASVTGLAWSADSRQLLLSATTDQGSQLYTARVSGRDLRAAPLPTTSSSPDPHHPAGPWLPRWSR